jgi:hypothetical protein
MIFQQIWMALTERAMFKALIREKKNENNLRASTGCSLNSAFDTLAKLTNYFGQDDPAFYMRDR